MEKLFLIGARRTGTTLALVADALKQMMSVIIICAPDYRLDGVFPPDVEIVYLQPRYEVILDFVRTVAGTQFYITTAHDSFAAVAARVARSMGVRGPEPASVIACSTKQGQKGVLAREGFQVDQSLDGFANCYLDLVNSIDPCWYPVIIKPGIGTASDGVKRCWSRAEAIQHCAEIATSQRCASDQRILIERFVDGPEFCVEIFDGRFVGALEKIREPGDQFLERGYSSKLSIDDNQLSQMISYCENAAEIAGLNWGPAHIDCILGPRHPRVVDLNPRISGSFIC